MTENMVFTSFATILECFGKNDNPKFGTYAKAKAIPFDTCMRNGFPLDSP